MRVFEYTLIRVAFLVFVLSTSSDIVTMVNRETQMINMGRGAYDTTGVPKPPPRPKPN